MKKRIFVLVILALAAWGTHESSGYKDSFLDRTDYRALYYAGKAEFHDIPDQAITEDMARHRLKGNEYYRFEYLPSRLRTEKLFLELITAGKIYYLKDLPVFNRTKTVCEVAVAKYGNNLKWVPDHLLTYDLCLSAVEYSDAEEVIKKDLPKQCETQEVYSLAVLNDPDALAFVPSKFVTYQMALIAVSKSGNLYRGLEQEFREDSRIIEAAVRDDWSVIDDVAETNEALLTEKVIRLAVSQNPEALRYVPAEKISFENSVLALRKSNDAWPYVPKIYMLTGTPEQKLQMLALANNIEPSRIQ